MTSSTALRIAALLGALAVGLGAFGAHGLKNLLAQNNTAAIWEKAVFYHFIHAIMLFILAGRSPLQLGPWLCFLLGIAVFSGSLYLLAVTNIRWFGAITQGCRTGIALRNSAEQECRTSLRLALGSVWRQLESRSSSTRFPPPTVAQFEFPGPRLR